MTRSVLYRFLITEQARIQAALDEIKHGPEADVIRGQWAMTQEIIEQFNLGYELGKLH